MKPSMVIGAAAALAGLVLTHSPSARAGGVAVVELFTSQGCSSCPPADALLGELTGTPDVIPLSLHVDYWDGLGWKDPFAQARFTRRQHRYADRLEDENPYTSGVYTPQMIVDGRYAMVGHAEGRVRESLDRARGEPDAVVPRFEGDGPARVVIPAGDGQPAGVWLLTYDARHETEVARGENRGRRLVNQRVVRSMERIGEWRGERATFPVDADAARSAGRDGLVVLVQRDGPGSILGAADAALRSPD